MTIADALAALVAERAENDIPDPLRESFTLATVWADLARIAGEPIPPAEVAAVLDAPAVERVPARAARWLPTDAA